MGRNRSGIWSHREEADAYESCVKTSAWGPGLFLVGSGDNYGVSTTVDQRRTVEEAIWVATAFIEKRKRCPSTHLW